MYNDADIEMIELAGAGRDIANGVCPLCDEALDPMAPKWDDPKHWSPRYTRANAAAYVGPHSNVVEGYHDRCMTEGDDHLY